MESEEHFTTAQKVKNMPGWENLDDELAEGIAKTVRKFAELFYITISRNMNLNPLLEEDLSIEREKPKRKKKAKVRV